MEKHTSRMNDMLMAFFLCLLFLCPVMTTAVADTVLPVSTHAQLANAISNHVGQTFTLELQSASLWLGGTPAISIPAGTHVTLTNKAGVAVTVIRHPFLPSADSRMDINGSLTIRENTAGGGSLTFDGGGDYCAGNPQLAVEGPDSQLTIESGSFLDHSSGYGVIYSADGATTAIKGGIFRGNESSFKPKEDGTGQGGVIWAANCNLTINGGVFDGNTAGLTGGVVFYEGRTTQNKLLVTGGLFSNNVAHSVFGGGALFVDCQDEDGKYSLAEVAGGVFDHNNAPNGMGGAIYVQKRAQVKIGDASLWHNTATDDGGGIWNCPTGGGSYYSFHGMYLSGNTAGGKGDDFYSDAKNKQTAQTIIYLTDYAYTGEKFNWEYDDGVHAPGTLAPSEYYQNSHAEIALVSGLPSLEEPMAKVFFRNNHGKTGGAVANNGILQMGEMTLLAVRKQTTAATSRAFHFELRLFDKKGKPMAGSFLCQDSATGAPGRILFDAGGIGRLTLAAGQEITLQDLPEGTRYVVTEVALPDGWLLNSPNDVTGSIVPKANEPVPMPSIAFVNEQTDGKPLPQTGDRFPFDAALALLLLSLVGIIALRLAGKRSRKHRD